MRYLSLFVVFVVLFGCTSPEPFKDYLCPDGTFVKNESVCPKFNPPNTNLNPDDYPSVTLESNKTNYVKSHGNVNFDVEIITGNKIWMNHILITPSGHPKNTEVTSISDNLYRINFSAPDYPGYYAYSIAKEDKTGNVTKVAIYNLTVISETNESRAYDIIKAFVLDSLRNYENQLNHTWGLGIGLNNTSKVITSTPTAWNISISMTYGRIVPYSFWYDLLNWNSFKVDGETVTNNTFTGHFLIDKKTGLIVG